jgi:parallel beta-helix repeat protein
MSFRVILGVLWLAVRGALCVEAATVTVPLGTAIQPLVTAQPSGTIFVLQAGVHRHQTVYPKTGQVFRGEPGAIMTGARDLSGLFTFNGQYWVVGQQTQQGQRTGGCSGSFTRCGYPEDLFLDDKPLRHVGTLAEVKPGRWYFDYAADRIYLADDPTGRTVETSVTRHAFVANAGVTDVTIRELTIEKYANPAQAGAIHGNSSDRWHIEDNRIRRNHGTGLRIGPRMIVQGNEILWNGQLGIGGLGQQSEITNNTITWNNFAGFGSGWEAGGIKVVKTSGIRIQHNVVSHNYAHGIWLDTDNTGARIEDNTAEYNYATGIFYETSTQAEIRHNTVRFNASVPNTQWLWGAQILLAGSGHVVVEGNWVEVAPTAGGDGIGIIQQDRRTSEEKAAGVLGRYLALDNAVLRNTVVHHGAVGQTGLVLDWPEAPVLDVQRNRFDENTYYVPRSDQSRWVWGSNKTWTAWRAVGHDPNGRVIIGLPSAPKGGE